MMVYLAVSCRVDSNCNGLGSNSICLNGICTCIPGYIPDGKYSCIPAELTTTPATTTTTIYYDGVPGSSCRVDSNCNGLGSNSICLNGICTCIPGYIPDGKYSCIPAELTTTPATTTTTIYYDGVPGSSCRVDSNCNGLGSNSICLNGICTCIPGYVRWKVQLCPS